MDCHPQEDGATRLATQDQEFAYHVETFHSEQEWLDARRHSIGASDAPTILGLTKYSPLALYHEKLGFERDEDKEFRKKLLRMGRLMEPVAAELFFDEATHVEPVGFLAAFPFHLERSNAIPWLTCTVDRFGRDKTLPGPELKEGPSPALLAGHNVVPIELKHVSVFAPSIDNWMDLGEVPLDFQVQVMHQLAVTGAPLGYIGAVIGTDFRWAALKRNDEFIAVLLKKEQEFFERLKAEEPPPADGLEDTKEFLNEFRKKQGTFENAIELPPEFDELRDEHDAVKKQIKALETRELTIENTVKAYLTEHNAQIGALRDGRSYSWKMGGRNEPAREARTLTFPVLRRHEPKKVK